MNILLDTCIWAGVGDILRDAGYDVVWAGNWIPDPGDVEILSRAMSEQRILITLDKDFGELAILRKLPHAGIIRLVNVMVSQQAKVTLHVLEHSADVLLSGAIITAEVDRIRIRMPDAE